MNSTQLRQMIVDGLRNQVVHQCGMFTRNAGHTGVRQQLEDGIAVLAFAEKVATDPEHFGNWGMVPIGKTILALRVAMDRISDISDKANIQRQMDYAAEFVSPKLADDYVIDSIRREGAMPMPRQDTAALNKLAETTTTELREGDGVRGYAARRFKVEDDKPVTSASDGIISPGKPREGDSVRGFTAPLDTGW